jgi:hypothetical protein
VIVDRMMMPSELPSLDDEIAGAHATSHAVGPYGGNDDPTVRHPGLACWSIKNG